MRLTMQIMALTLGSSDILGNSSRDSGSSPPIRRLWHRSVTIFHLSSAGDFRLPPRRKRDLSSSGILRGVRWSVPTFWDNLLVPFLRVKQSSWTKLLPANSRKSAVCLPSGHHYWEQWPH